MTNEQFEQFIWEDIPCALYHVDANDIDDNSGGKVDETILVNLIAQNIKCLKYKSLQWFLDTFIISKEK